MNVKRLLFVLILFCFKSSFLFAQSPVFGFWDAGITYKGPVSDNWSYAINLTTRTDYLEQGEGKFQLRHIQLPSILLSHKLSSGSKISGGYLFRYKAPYFDEQFNYEHRFIEKFEFDIKIKKNKTGNRLQVEQRIFNTGWLNRIRYRIKHKFPLTKDQEGMSKNFLILYDEFLYKFDSNTSAFDNRIFVGVGWLLSDRSKFETGVEYRTVNIGPNEEHVFRLITALSISK